MTTDVLSFTANEIKKVTPYLDEIPEGRDRPPVILTPKERAFAWYYVHEGNHVSRAHIRAFLMTIPNSAYNSPDDVGPVARRQASTKGSVLRHKADVKKAIEMIFHYTVKEYHVETQDTILGQLAIQATYDPAMFYDLDGTPVFHSWNDIPPRYRCCVKELKTAVHGRDGDVRVIEMKLADRMAAGEKYFKMTGAYPTEKMELTGRNGGPVAFTRSGEASTLSEDDQLTVLAIMRGKSNQETQPGLPGA